MRKGKNWIGRVLEVVVWPWNHFFRWHGYRMNTRRSRTRKNRVTRNARGRFQAKQPRNNRGRYTYRKKFGLFRK